MLTGVPLAACMGDTMPVLDVQRNRGTVADSPSASGVRQQRHSGKRLQRAAKAVLDFAGAMVLLTALSPVILLIALFIKLDDGGPVFYRRRVVGRAGEFDAFKFRTMVTNADAVLMSDSKLREKFEQNFKLKNDPRVTRVGSFLRKYSLDELPQFLNVLQGRMSLVGPRMITAAELDKYGAFGQRLLEVRPGLTGYWQVNGRQKVSYEERVKMDVYYLDHWSLILDLEILLKTPVRVIRGEGAY